MNPLELLGMYTWRVSWCLGALVPALFSGWPMLFRGAWHFVRTGALSPELQEYVRRP